MSKLIGCTIKTYTVVETVAFRRSADEIWNVDEREGFINWIAYHPHAGDVIPGGGGLRKVRWSRRGMGKRGGVRVIYFTHSEQEQVWLLISYTKARFDNLPVNLLLKWKDVIHG